MRYAVVFLIADPDWEPRLFYGPTLEGVQSSVDIFLYRKAQEYGVSRDQIDEEWAVIWPE